MAQTIVAPLGLNDVAPLGLLLGVDPICNVYLRSELRLTPPSGQWLGLSADGSPRAAVLAGPLVVPWIPHLADAPALAEALRRHQPATRMMVGPRDSVMALHQALNPGRRPRHLRDPQPVMVTKRDSLRPAPTRGRVRRATRADLEQLVVSAAAMHREEMGIDPLAVDAPGWWLRMTTLVDRGWSWLWMEHGEIIFKTELSAWTPECAQLQGVYVAPAHRRQGIGAAGLTAVIDEVLTDVPRVALYVNHHNEMARRLYARLGFVECGAYATLIY